MPRVYRTQKEYEAFLIREFVSCLGYRIAKSQWQERPDAILTLQRGKSQIRIAVEHTDYYNDTVAGVQSPLTPISDFWKAVQYSLARRISHRRHLSGLSGAVNLNMGSPQLLHPAPGLARQLAQELIGFMENHPAGVFQHYTYHPSDFASYPMLETMVFYIILSRWTDDEVFTSHCSWTCSNITTGFVGLNLNYIKTAVEKKNQKAVDYHWKDADEKWLLIAAGGRHISTDGWPLMQCTSWGDESLVAVCRGSPFDKIILWDRVHCWYKWLKPDEKPVRYRDPYLRASF
jgi:hypothetical protein